MMNIQNLGSQESVEVKYIDGICAKFCLNVWFKSTGIFVLLLSQVNAIQKQNSKQSLHKFHLEATMHRFSSKQVFLKFSHRCFPMNIAKFLRTVFLQKTSGGCFFQFDKVTA